MISSKNHYEWEFASVLIAALVIFPIIALIGLAINGEASVWSHLSQTVLPSYIVESLQLMLGISLLSLLVGVGCAWLVTQYQFPLSRIFNWALLLPLAMPAYITAYSYTGIFEVAGPVQSFLRQQFGLSYGQYWFPEIRSMTGAIFVMSFVLYPYIYLLARASFHEQSRSHRDAGQLFGYSKRQTFFKISLPIARPAIIAGLSLVLMETLADYGTVEYFGINTFTTGIFRTWYGLGSVSSAAQLALVLLMFVIVLLVLEQYSHRRARYHEQHQAKRFMPTQLTGIKSWVAFALCCIPLVLGFLLPTSQLVFWSLDRIEQLFDASFWRLVEHTVLLASITALAALSLALIIAYSHRIRNSKITKFCKQAASLGYAIPGTVVAVGTLIPLAFFDNQIDAWFRQHFDFSTGLLLSGTLVALIIAYLVRFLAVSLQSVDTGLNNIVSTMDQAGRSLGSSPLLVLKRIHIPMLKSSLLTATLIVFVDVMKELPATLILRPFDFNTLAVRAYELASDERLADAALPALMIVLAGLIPVILLTSAITQKQDHH